MQQFLKPAARAARAGIFTSEFFEQLFVTANDPMTAHHARFGGEAFLSFATRLESKTGRR